MTEAQKILSLIETVSPDDTDALDEIDARVWCFVNRKSYEKIIYEAWGGDTANVVWNGIITRDRGLQELKSLHYTRSRDALKAIRPDGWLPVSYWNHTGWVFVLEKLGTANGYQGDDETNAIILPTEELAELHAIIQAIEYERTSK